MDGCKTDKRNHTVFVCARFVFILQNCVQRKQAKDTKKQMHTKNKNIQRAELVPLRKNIFFLIEDDLVFTPANSHFH